MSSPLGFIVSVISMSTTVHADIDLSVPVLQGEKMARWDEVYVEPKPKEPCLNPKARIEIIDIEKSIFQSYMEKDTQLWAPPLRRRPPGL